VRYEILVEGVLDDTWSAWFDGLDVSGDSDAGVTTIAGRSPTRRHFTDCSPRSAISASRRSRCAASDPTLTQDGSSHVPRWNSRPERVQHCWPTVQFAVC
jgi:hypothetical protein